MTTAPKTPLTRADAADDIETRILDAALAQFQKFGFKKTTIEDVAKQAGVDRVTVYRRLGSRDDLVQAVVSREVANLLAELAGMPERHTDLADLIADIFVTVITGWRAHPLVERQLALEPERIVTKLTVDGETVFAMTVAATVQIFEQAARKGIFEAPKDLAARTEVACRVVHSLILVQGGAAALETPDELAQFARTYLVPVIAG
ncbi:TetR/AcrR family transcriptional regulator [Nocardia sp. CDC160]|uniref:TetR/AcrR family transcriptional regulator n=1 Tax=Nocardia sp. CDC160 TaxID=3112166 RepID=UPI002DC05188|nr:helix-turn-helix domain-containing protein [Nocardia sp. CDC160]MEC3916010.1 helix-turn-helix domain-containing protein [Nocardia sp. CDC160]